MNLKDVPIVNLEKALGKVKKNRVRRIGIELEGGWTKLPPGVKLTHDGSIQFPYEAAVKLQFGGQGELPSPPLEMDVWQKWLQMYYPHIVNETCGMHVHLSFRTAMVYQRLMAPSYPATVIAYVTSWAKEEKLAKGHPIWSRLRGESEYCQHTFFADQQVRATGKDHDRRRTGNRYSVVNYCYGRHSTLECRLLPMMETKEQASRAIQHLIDTTNAYLVTTAAREERVRAEHVINEEVLREERKIYI